MIDRITTVRNFCRSASKNLEHLKLNQKDSMIEDPTMTFLDSQERVPELEQVLKNVPRGLGKKSPLNEEKRKVQYQLGFCVLHQVFQLRQTIRKTKTFYKMRLNLLKPRPSDNDVEAQHLCKPRLEKEVELEDQVRESELMIKQLQTEILELHEENSKLIVQGRQLSKTSPLPPTSITTVAQQQQQHTPDAHKATKCKKIITVGKKDIPGLLDQYFGSFQRLFHEFAQTILNEKILTLESWIQFCHHHAFRPNNGPASLVPKVTDDQFVSFTTIFHQECLPEKGWMDFCSFVEGLVQLADHIDLVWTPGSAMKEQQETFKMMIKRMNETERFVMVMIHIEQQSKRREHSLDEFPKLYATVDFQPLNSTPPGPKCSTLSSQGSSRVSRAYIQSTEVPDLQQVIAMINQVLGPVNNARLQSHFSHYASRPMGKYLDLVNFVTLVRDYGLIMPTGQGSESNLRLVNRAFDQATQEEARYVRQVHGTNKPFTDQKSVSFQKQTENTGSHHQRMSYNAFKLALMKLAQTQQRTPGRLHSSSFLAFLQPLTSEGQCGNNSRDTLVHSSA